MSEHNFLNRTVLFSISLTFLLASCKSSFEKLEDYQQTTPTVVSANLSEVQAPEGFDFKTQKSATLTLSSVVTSTGSQAENVEFSIVTRNDKMEPVQLVNGTTDEQGYWSSKITLPIDRDSIDLVVKSAGFSNLHRVGIGDLDQVNYTIGKELNTSGRIIDGVSTTEDNQGNLNQSGTLSSRSGFNYIGTWDNQGKPNYLTTPFDVPSELLEFISINLPEGDPVPAANPQYLADNIESSIHFTAPGELWVSFIHEGAGHRNAVGYYTYPLGNPPSTVAEINTKTIVFPNASFRYSGGDLTSGDRVYLGNIPANTGVGFFLVPNGWNASSKVVADNQSTRYTNDDLNTFTTEDFRKHIVLLPNSTEEILVIGFEDLNRPGGDNDFNDAILVAEVTPWSAVSRDNTPSVKEVGQDSDEDGVPDTQDLYPNDGARAFENHTPAQGVYGTLAYEDMWPKTGDYDFNDLVIDYNFTEILNGKNAVKEIIMDLRVRAMGASQNHGFALQLPTNPALIEAIKGQVLTENYIPVSSNGTETGLSTTVVPVFTNGFSLFNQTHGIINTDPEKSVFEDGILTVSIVFKTPVERSVLGTAPYDPFMIKSQDRSLEIHLAGNAPTSKADMSYFNTEADDSDLNNNFYYIDKNNLPWALSLPEQFSYPKERIPINEVYTNFPTWATFGGAEGRQWFRPSSGTVNDNNSY